MEINIAAFYGSLRKDQYNYNAFRLNEVADLLGTYEIEGFQLYDYGSYPFAKFTGNSDDKLIVDLMKVNDQTTWDRIHRMEAGAGYEQKIINIDGKDCAIYVYNSHRINTLPRVIAGDWVKHLEERSQKYSKATY